MRDERKRTGSSVISRSSTINSPAEGEFNFISRIKRRAETARGRRAQTAGLILGIGDDAAVLRARAGFDSVITADLLVEDIDFRRASLPQDIGYKALAVSLSDIAAMGARPRWTLLSLGLPQGVYDTPYATGIYEGFLSAARRFGVVLVGGDVSRTPERIVLDSIVIGEVRRGRAVLRSGARTGDHIYVTGTLGGAAAGLRLMEHVNGLRTRAARIRSLSKFEALARRQARPLPRVECGALLGERRLASALIDLSDGLSSDLTHLCEQSGVGALIEAARVPIASLLRRADAISSTQLARNLTGDAFALALHGGEDFELLFTVRPRVAARLPLRLGGVPLTRIGEVREAHEGIRISHGGRAEMLRPSGFDHFKRAR
jgi:thiamine-monophosphate kinase